MSLKTDQQKVCVEAVKKLRPGDYFGPSTVTDFMITLQFILEELEN